jgi:hypothetical protein
MITIDGGLRLRTPCCAAVTVGALGIWDRRRRSKTIGYAVIV